MGERTIAIGDIHGCQVALDRLLEQLKPARTDTIIVLGDVVDRGPDTRTCIDRLLELRRECRFVHLLGNHEEMLLDALAEGTWTRTWLNYGGREMLASYGGAMDEIPVEHLDFLKAGKDYYETDSTIFAHAAINPALPLELQTAQALRWHRLTGNEPPHVSGKLIVCGHTAQAGARPLIFPGWMCIDTCAYCPNGALSALVLEEQHIYQTDQNGEFRGVFAVDEFV